MAKRMQILQSANGNCGITSRWNPFYSKNFESFLFVPFLFGRGQDLCRKFILLIIMIMLLHDPPSSALDEGGHYVGDVLKLFHALSFGHVSTIKRLILSKRVPIQCKDTRNGWPILFYAIRFGYNNLVEFLLDNGHEDGHISKDIMSNTALIIAIMFDNISAFDMYIKRFPQVVHMKNNFGESPLILAAKKGNNFFLKILLEYGANINDTDNDGCTALHHAAAWAHTRTISFLIKAGCNFAAQSKKGWTAVDYSYTNDVAERLQRVAMLAIEGKRRASAKSQRNFYDIFEE